MTNNEINITIAEKLGFVWYKYRNSLIAASDYWGETRLSFPPEEGIGFEGSKGRVSETRLCTLEEIRLAKLTGEFNGLCVPDYSNSVDACQKIFQWLFKNDNTIHIRGLPSGWYVIINRSYGKMIADGEDKIIERAITKAFLNIFNEYKE